MFSWDAAKALHNLRKHGGSFEEAATVFADPEALDWADTVHSRARPQSGQVLMTSVPSVWENQRRDAYCSWSTPSRRTKDGKETIRIISARQASRKERAAYSELPD